MSLMSFLTSPAPVVRAALRGAWFLLLTLSGTPEPEP